jgi:hypothetical protein
LVELIEKHEEGYHPGFVIVVDGVEHYWFAWWKDMYIEQTKENALEQAHKYYDRIVSGELTIEEKPVNSAPPKITVLKSIEIETICK